MVGLSKIDAAAPEPPGIEAAAAVGVSRRPPSLLSEHEKGRRRPQTLAGRNVRHDGGNVMPKASNSRNGAEKQAKSAAVQPEINGAGVLTPQEAELIRGFVRALEHLEDEGREIGQNKSAIYKEAKLNQLSTWAIREVVKRRRQDPGVLELQDDLIKIYSDIAAGAKVRAAEPVARNEAAWQAGRADALAGHRDHAAGWRDKFGEVDYELGHQDGTELRQQAAEKLDRKPPPMASAPSIYEPVRKVARKRGTAEHLGDRQAASVKRAKRKGAQRPAA